MRSITHTFEQPTICHYAYLTTRENYMKKKYIFWATPTNPDQDQKESSH